MEDTPKWLQLVVLLLGSGGIIWTVWSKFGEAIKGAFKIKQELKSGSLDNASQEIDVMTKYKEFLNSEINDIMMKYKGLKSQVDIDHKKLTDQIKADRKIIEKQKNYIIYAVRKLTENNISHVPYNE